MLGALKSKFSFAQWLLLVLVAINLIGGGIFIAITAELQHADVHESRLERLKRSADLLQESTTNSMQNYSRAERRELWSVISPVMYSNQTLDLVGLYRLGSGWGQIAWTRADGDFSLAEHLPAEVVEELTASEPYELDYQDYVLVARPILHENPNTGEPVTVFLIAGLDTKITHADLVPRLRSIFLQLLLVVVIQILLVSVFLERALRRPLQRVSDKALGVLEDGSSLSEEMSGIGDLPRIEKAVEMLRESRLKYRQQEVYLRSILETMNDGILVLDSDANIVEVNQAFVSNWGYTLDDVKGQPIQNIFHPRHRTRFENQIKQYKETGEALAPDSIEKLEALDMNGREFPITYIYSEFSIGSERLWVVTVCDISEQEKQKEEIFKAKEIAEEAQKQAELAADAKASFLANMSHEIRTPMNGVMGLLDLVGETGLDSQQAALVKTAKVSAESLLNVLNDILDVSKIEAGKIDVEKMEFDLDLLVEEVVTLFHTAAVDKGLELTCFVEPSIDHYVIGDPTRLRQVISNIVGNAVKFTQEGEVEVRVERGGSLPGRYGLQILVRDTGIGMSESALETLFDPFSQADSSTTRKFGGTGLGMTISSQLTALMGGTIGVDSKLGKGTTFTISLQLPVSQRSGANYKNPDGLPETNILIVDDNATNREILGAYLSNWGIRYETAESAAAAMTMLGESTRSQFDVCLMDYHMPDEDGIDLANRIKSEGVAPNMVLALLSSGVADSKAIKAAGISDFLNKPIRQAELFDLIARCRDVRVEQREESSEPAAKLEGKVLLVEDNKVNQMVAQSLLEKMGFVVDLVEDGVQALEALASEKYDLVLMDCLMPVMDGYEATIKRREIELAENLDRTPIIALTANAMAGDRERCLDAGMDDFLSKPIKLDEMKEKLSLWLEKAASDQGEGSPLATTD